MRRLIDRFATEIIGVSPSALGKGYAFARVGDERARVIPNGVRPDLLSVAPAGSGGRGTILSLGRAAPEKNLVRMPSVVAAAREGSPSLQLRIVGPRDQDIDASLASLASSLAVPIHLEGASSDLTALFRDADVLLLTSLREGLPSVVLEAAVAGLPVVSSDVGGSVWISHFFPWVTCLSLGQDDSEWADALNDAIGCRPAPEVVEQAFRASPFSLTRTVSLLKALYDNERDVVAALESRPADDTVGE